MYTMKQACEATGLPYETLKFYCNEGLIPHVKRDRLNRRIFSEHDVAWIKSLKCLKGCGLSIQEMREYLQMCLQGPASIPKREKMLKEKRKNLEEKIQEIQESIAYIDWKETFYDDVLSGKKPYVSNLLPEYAEDSEK